MEDNKLKSIQGNALTRSCADSIAHSQPSSLPQKYFLLKAKNIALASGVGSISSHRGSTIDRGLFPVDLNAAGGENAEKYMGLNH